VRGRPLSHVQKIECARATPPFARGSIRGLAGAACVSVRRNLKRTGMKLRAKTKTEGGKVSALIAGPVVIGLGAVLFYLDIVRRW
jgi:hypothetical protein